MSTKKFVNITFLAILIGLTNTAFGQNRPTPEPPPDIDLPTRVPTPAEPPTIEELPVEIVEDPILEETIEVEPEVVDIEPDIEELPAPTADESDEVEFVSGTETNSSTRWPIKREIPTGLVVLAFDEVTIDETLGFIAQTTGKVVIPVSASSLRAKKITLRNDEPVDRGVALDLLFQAFRLNQIGVIERDDIIIIGPLDTMLTDIGDIPVLGESDDVMNRQDRGTLVIKVFAVEITEASVIGDRINEMFPDYGLLTVYPDSNQIVLLGDIGLCQQVQQLINQLDRIWRSGRLKTFRLKYADASEISTNILDLFEETATGTTTNRAQGGNRARATTTSAGRSSRTSINCQHATKFCHSSSRTRCDGRN